MIAANLKTSHQWAAFWVFPLVPHGPCCHSSIVVVNERPVQRDTQVKRQLTIDCGQKGFWYIRYCHCASSIDLEGEINVLQDVFIYLLSHGESCKWIWRVDFLRVVVLLCTDTSLKLIKAQVSLQVYFHYKIQTNFFSTRPGGSLSLIEKSVEWHWVKGNANVLHCNIFRWTGHWRFDEFLEGLKLDFSRTNWNVSP